MAVPSPLRYYITSNGKIVQSSINSAISYKVKKQTGKTPLEHAIAYAEKNPEKKIPVFLLLNKRSQNFVLLQKNKYPRQMLC